MGTCIQVVEERVKWEMGGGRVLCNIDKNRGWYMVET